MMMTQAQVTHMKKWKHLFNLLMWGCWTSYINDRNSVCSCKRVFKTQTVIQQSHPFLKPRFSFDV